jgi:hypothetical protein
VKNLNFNAFLTMIEELGHAFIRASRYVVRAMGTMSWPQLLVTCIALALAISIIPLALTLFIIFMAVKIIVAAIILAGRRRKLHNNTIDQ